MSERNQFGLHPDADQLNAFVENVLPPHEQEQTLAHLAVCPVCRTIVSLSLPEGVETVRPQAEAARRPWFSGWNLAWPVGAAFATLVPLVLYFHRATTTDHSIATPTQIGEVQLQTPPAAAPSLASGAPTPRAAVAKTSSPAATPSDTSATRAADGKVSERISSDAPKSLDTTNATLSGTIGNELYSQLPLSMNGAPRDSTAFQHPVPGVESRQALAAGRAADNGNSAIYGGTGQTNLNENYIEGVPVANIAQPTGRVAAAAPANASTQAVTVTDAPPMLETSDAAAAGLPEPAAAPQNPLPSGLPILSTATSGRLTVAIDTGHSVFVSDDGGRRWRPVPSQWKGRAVRVDLATTSDAPLRGQALAAATGLARKPSKFAAVPPATLPANSGVAGVVTDATGAAVANASITVSDAAKQTVSRAKTDSAGRYRIDGIAPGTYHIDALARGFETLDLAVALAPAQQSVTNLRLQVAAATESVTVTAASAIATAGASHGNVANKAILPAASAPPTPLLEIITESGDRWTSFDGQTWTRRP